MSNGDIYVGGFTNSSDGDLSTPIKGMADAWVLKLNSSGDKIWQKTFGGTNEELVYAILPAKDNGVFVAGFSGSKDIDLTGNKGYYDAWIFKLDQSGNYVWQQNIRGTADDKILALAADANDNIIISGATASSDGDMLGNYGFYDYWMMSLR